MRWTLDGRADTVEVHPKRDRTGASMLDASQLLGSAQLAGVIVVPKGTGASAARAGANVDPGGAAYLPLVMRRGGRGSQPVPSDVTFATPRFAGYGFLALTAQELALVYGPRQREVQWNRWRATRKLLPLLKAEQPVATQS
jgi:hypothetical protein